MSNSPESPHVATDPFYAEDLRQMGHAVNYQAWQFGMVEPFLGERVLEIGGGIGTFTTMLAGRDRKVVSVEPNESCFRELQECTKAMENVRTFGATVETLGEVLGEGQTFDCVVMMNVLEHIEDDLATLADLRGRLAAGGRLVIIVPAGEWAFGKIDRRLGHYRRYSKSYSRSLFAKAGLRIKAIRYYNFVGIWGWWLNAKVGKLEGQSDAQISFFDSFLVPVMSRLERWVKPPVGQSLLIVGTAAEHAQQP